MEKNILTKAEILWTRKCNLHCPYCAMATGKGNTRTLHDWKSGLDNLKDLGCAFAAFYGAEPLADFDSLAKTVGYAEHIGINTTVITGGVVPSLKKKLNFLYNHGARSLSMSFDIKPLGKDSRKKSKLAKENLLYFQSLGSNVRDVAAICTLTRTNFMDLPATIKAFSACGIWTFFDLIHPDRGQPGSKCKGGSKDLLFRKEDLQPLNRVMNEILLLKEEAYLVHTSEKFIECISRNNYGLLQKYNWNCGESDSFPSWVTVDCDGSVHYCDDYMPKEEQSFDMTEIYMQWDSFRKQAQESVKKCPGCAWNTHMDSNFVKEGKLDLHSYIHGEWNE